MPLVPMFAILLARTHTHTHTHPQLTVRQVEQFNRIHVNAHLSKNCKYWNVSAIVR